jgi:hypothetical protein
MSIGETDDPLAVIQTYEAAVAVTKGDAVYLSEDGKVSPAAAAQDGFGIATKTVAAGVGCPVLKRGRVKVAAGGAITIGKAVYGADSSHRVMALGDISEGGSTLVSWTKKLGKALQTVTTAGDLLFIDVG